MHPDRYFFREGLLQHPQVWSLVMLFLERFNLIFGKKRELFNVFRGIGIAGVKPELVKFIG